jgi:hypothetical protein
MELNQAYHSFIMSLARSICSNRAGHTISPESFTLHGARWYSGTTTFGFLVLGGDIAFSALRFVGLIIA